MKFQCNAKPQNIMKLDCFVSFRTLMSIFIFLYFYLSLMLRVMHLPIFIVLFLRCSLRISTAFIDSKFPVLRSNPISEPDSFAFFFPLYCLLCIPDRKFLSLSAFPMPCVIRPQSLYQTSDWYSGVGNPIKRRIKLSWTACENSLETKCTNLHSW